MPKQIHVQGPPPREMRLYSQPHQPELATSPFEVGSPVGVPPSTSNFLKTISSREGAHSAQEDNKSENVSQHRQSAHTLQSAI